MACYDSVHVVSIERSCRPLYAVLNDSYRSNLTGEYKALKIRTDALSARDFPSHKNEIKVVFKDYSDPQPFVGRAA
jgi:hypothetical protein